MPATAGRVKMPHDNRVMTSSSLATHSVWKNVIGYDPYANPEAEEAGDKTNELLERSAGLMELAKLQAQTAGEKLRPTCTKCNGTGHLSYECKNFIKLPPRAGAIVTDYEEIPEIADDDVPVIAVEALKSRDRSPSRSRSRSRRRHKSHKTSKSSKHRRRDASEDSYSRRKRRESHRHSRDERDKKSSRRRSRSRSSRSSDDSDVRHRRENKDGRKERRHRSVSRDSRERARMEK